MYTRFTRRTLAIALVLAAAGCANQTGLVQAPSRHAPRPNGPFRDGLAAPPGAHAANYGLQALFTSPHLLGAAFVESTQAPCVFQFAPELGYNSQDDTYLAVWDEVDITGHFTLRGRIKDSHGVQQVPDITIANSAEIKANGKVGYLPWLNQFVVVYASQTSSLPWNYDVYMQRISDSGALIGYPVPISTALGDQEVPDLAVDPINHRVEVVWQDDRSGTNAIFARLMSFTGDQTVMLTGETLLGDAPPEPDHGYTTADEYDPTIDFSTQQQKYAVVWEDYRNANNDMVSSGEDLYGTTLNAKGMPITMNYPVSTLEGDQYNPSIAYLAPSDKFLVAFTSENNGADDSDILGVGMDGDGSVLGWGVISNQFGPQQYPIVAGNNASMTWLVGYTESANPEAGDMSRVMARHVGWAFQLGDIFNVSPLQFTFAPTIGLAANTDNQEFLMDYDSLTVNGMPVSTTSLGAPVKPPSGPTPLLVPQVPTTFGLYVYGQRIDRGY